MNNDSSKPKSQRERCATLALGILLLASAGCTADKVTHGIPNLAKVEEGVWRGGQPNAEGWAWLRSQGILYDIKLNTWDEAPEPKLFPDGIWIDYEPIPLSEQLFGVNGYTVDSAVQTLMDRTPMNAVFIHCEHGQDRTGLVIATYRVRVEHWKKAAAEKEMLAHGFHKSLAGLWNYWKTSVPPTIFDQ